MAPMGRKKTTVYIDEELLRTAKVRAARSGKRDYEVFEDALRAYLEFDELIERVRSKSDLSEEEAIELANAEVRAHRAERRGQ